MRAGASASWAMNVRRSSGVRVSRRSKVPIGERWSVMPANLQRGERVLIEPLNGGDVGHCLVRSIRTDFRDELGTGVVRGERAVDIAVKTIEQRGDVLRSGEDVLARVE